MEEKNNIQFSLYDPNMGPVSHRKGDSISDTMLVTEDQFEFHTETKYKNRPLFCRICGAKLFEDSLFCHACGTKVIFGTAGESKSTTKPIKQTETKTDVQKIKPNIESPIASGTNVITDKKILGMAWYNFLVKFSLIAGAVLNIIYGIGYLTGGIYHVQTNGEVSADQVYRYFGNGLQIVDMVMGLYVIAIAVLCIVARSELAKYNKKAPLWLLLVYIFNFAGYFLYAIAASLVTDTSAFDASTVISMVVSLLILGLNYWYFEKRKHLFIN